MPAIEKFGGKADYYLPDGSVNPTPTDNGPAIKRAMEAASKEHDDCFCDEPLAPEEETADKELPEATGGVAA